MPHRLVLGNRTLEFGFEFLITDKDILGRIMNSVHYRTFLVQSGYILMKLKEYHSNNSSTYCCFILIISLIRAHQ